MHSSAVGLAAAKLARCTVSNSSVGKACITGQEGTIFAPIGELLVLDRELQRKLGQPYEFAHSSTIAIARNTAAIFAIAYKLSDYHDNMGGGRDGAYCDPGGHTEKRGKPRPSQSELLKFAEDSARAAEYYCDYCPQVEPAKELKLIIQFRNLMDRNTFNFDMIWEEKYGVDCKDAMHDMTKTLLRTCEDYIFQGIDNSAFKELEVRWIDDRPENYALALGI